MTLSLQEKDLRRTVCGMGFSERLLPGLAEKSNVNAPAAYRRFRDSKRKKWFRRALIVGLSTRWASERGPTVARKIALIFRTLSATLAERGAVIFGDLICRENFGRLVTQYDQMMRDHASHGPLHSFFDLRSDPKLLIDNNYSDAFLHPVIVALVAHRIGGPVRVSDARCKDTRPLSARVQDNVLHIDNTPFNDEFKAIVTWEKGSACGPKGQNFAFLPATNQGTRNCFVSDARGAWSTENCSVFTTVDRVDHVFQFQRLVTSASTPTVIEVQDQERPLTTVFEAGALVHHRYRTDEGATRSSITVTFHSPSDNPGQLLRCADVAWSRELDQYLYGYQDDFFVRGFLDAVLKCAGEIATKLAQLGSYTSGSVVVDQDRLKLSPDRLKLWYAAVTAAPDIEEIKRNHQDNPFGRDLTRDEFLAVLGRNMMFYDKYGPLDLILYADNHEESRKWARNRIREMKLCEMDARLLPWAPELRQPQLEDILLPEDLIGIAWNLIQCIDRLTSAERTTAMIDDATPPDIALRSMRQLLNDLAEAFTRCHSFQTFLSTSLFLFWSCDELFQIRMSLPDGLRPLGGRLLRHYIATAILVDDLGAGMKADAHR